MQEAITAPIEDDEISLIDLFAVLLRYKVMIIVLTGLAAVGVVVFSVISLKLPPEKSPLPNQFTAKADMLILGSSSSSRVSGILGVGIPRTTMSMNNQLAVDFISSDALLDAVTDKFGIIERYGINEYVPASSRNMLKKKLTADLDRTSGFFTVSFTDIDPAFAQEVVNFVVDWLGARFDELGLDDNTRKKENLEKNIQASYDEILRLEREVRSLGAQVAEADMTRVQTELGVQKELYTQLRLQYEFLKVDMQNALPMFQILARPEFSQKSGPSRGKLCIIVVFATFFLSVFMAFALNAFENIRNDPEAWKKLTQKQEK